MPLTFPIKNISELTYSAASISEILIDINSQRVLITVEYGNVVNGVFVRNKSISRRVYTLDGAKWTALAVAKPDALLGMYDNVKNFAWRALINAGLETGTVS